MIIAIDGPAASGKGTLARRIAAHFDYHYLDTGLLYRAVARDCRERGIDLTDACGVAAVARSIDPARLDDTGLRAPGVGDAASIVAKIPEVRAALLDYQRSFARRPPGAVLDGRDIGTVVCPDADVKIFVTASVEERAKRRLREYQAAGKTPEMQEMLDLIRARDARDSNRGAAPMRQADDADLLDTTEMDIETAFDAAVGLIKRKIGQ
jgi:cytidylate kinase